MEVLRNLSVIAGKTSKGDSDESKFGDTETTLDGYLVFRLKRSEIWVTLFNNLDNNLLKLS